MRWNTQSRVIAAPGFIAPALPTVASNVPQGPLWIHEIKHDGYLLLVRKREGKVRIYTPGGVPTGRTASRSSSRLRIGSRQARSISTARASCAARMA